MKAIVLALFLAVAASGGQSLNLTPGLTGSYRVPNTKPYQALGDFTVELRLHDFGGCQQNYTNIWQFGVLQLRCHLAGASVIAMMDGAASAGVLINLADRPDVLLRIQRDTREGKIYGEIWNSDGSGYQQVVRKDTSRSQANVSGKQTVGGGQTRVKIDWVRWQSTRIPLGGPPPTEGLVGDLAEWRLDGDTRDFGPAGMDLSIAGDFALSPAYRPVVIARTANSPTWTNALPARAGETIKLDGSGSYGMDASAIASYAWEQLSGPSEAAFSSTSVSEPQVSGLIAGEYLFQLTVTDRLGQTSSTSLKLGVVEAGENDVVIQSDPAIDFLFGPLIRLGASPWPFADEIHTRLADHFGQQMPEDDWNRPLRGSINLLRHSTRVAGEQTQFQTDFCGGPGNSQPNGARLVVWYETEGGKTGRRAYGVESCPTDDELVLVSRYDGPSSNREPVAERMRGRSPSRGLQYAKMACVGCWINGSNNANYYDNVMAFYSLYYRTGLLQYRDYARELADRWWSMPFVDEGRCLPNCVNAPRLLSLAGMFARALDDRPDMWEGLHRFLDAAVPGVRERRRLWDIRENAYQVAFVALGAKLDPDANRRERYRAALIDAIRYRWKPQQRDDGSWINPSYGLRGRSAHPPNSIDVTNGSNVVIGNRTSSYWNGDMKGRWLLVDGDEVAYYTLPGSDSERILLDRPYEGPSAKNRDYQLNNLVGDGVQPFTLGIVGTAWAYAYHATGDDQAREFVVDTARWLHEYGTRMSTRGLYYGRVYPPCEPNPDVAPNCVYGDATNRDVIAGERFLNAEVFNTFAQAYLISGDPEIRAHGDLLYGAALGKEGGPDSDNSYAEELDSTAQANKWKNFGFFFGFGFASNWPAARLIEPEPGGSR